MSLAIDVDQVTAVLLADGWHSVEESSFELDSYEFIWYHNDAARERDDFTTLHGGGENGVCATGFSFKAEAGNRISGPLTAVLAVRY